MLKKIWPVDNLQLKSGLCISFYRLIISDYHLPRQDSGRLSQPPVPGAMKKEQQQCHSHDPGWSRHIEETRSRGIFDPVFILFVLADPRSRRAAGSRSCELGEANVRAGFIPKKLWIAELAPFTFPFDNHLDFRNTVFFRKSGSRNSNLIQTPDSFALRPLEVLMVWWSTRVFRNGMFDRLAVHLPLQRYCIFIKRKMIGSPGYDFCCISFVLIRTTGD